MADGRGTNSYFYDKLDLVKTVDRLTTPTPMAMTGSGRRSPKPTALGTITRLTVIVLRGSGTM